jgi:putative membrane protein
MKIFILGILMGVSNLIPGISAGTIAIISGKYEKIILSASDLISLKIKKENFIFLLNLILGIVIAIFSFSKIVSYLFERYENYFLSFFIGLIFSGLFFMIKKLKINKSSLSVLGFSFIVFFIVLTLINAEKNGENFSTNFLLIFLSGVFGASAMILPGISGSTIFLILGVYEPIISAVSNFQLSILIPLALGVITGLIVLIKILKIFLSKSFNLTMAFLIGLTIAGMIKIVPMKFNFLILIFYILGIISGFLIEKFLNSKVEK